MPTHIAAASVAACVSRIVLEEKMPKQQGAGDKQAIRDSLKQPTAANIVEHARTQIQLSHKLFSHQLDLASVRVWRADNLVQTISVYCI